MSVDLTLVWAGLLAFAVFAYIVMDGFDPVSYTHLTLPTKA